jgi:hypothetical protein
MNVGFSGTRQGLTDKQKASLKNLLFKIKHKKSNIIFHHGDCIGADECLHELLAIENIPNKIVVHPPDNSNLRAFVPLNHSSIEIEITEEKEYLARNRDIVDSSELVIICPKEHEEILRSGTWNVYRYSKKKNKVIIIVYPDGSTERWPDRRLIKRMKENNNGKTSEESSSS